MLTSSSDKKQKIIGVIEISEPNVRWELEDVQGRKIVLRDTTYDEHITSDHAGEDAEMRKFLESQAKGTLMNPGLILKDEPGRLLYYSVIRILADNQITKIKIMKVVTETDREPAEVVTWTPLRKGDNVKNGVIIYGTSCISD